MRFLLIFVTILFSIMHANARADSDLVANITPLMQAVVDQDLKGVKFFSNSGRAIINKQNDGGATALHIAARMGNLSIVQHLINNSADVNIQDNEGWTPLMRSASFSFSKITKELLEAGARIEKVNDNSDSAILLAARSGCFDCFRDIVQNSFYNKYISKTALKNELSKSFTIAQNKNKSELQDFIENQIDRLNKMTKDDSQSNNLAEVYSLKKINNDIPENKDTKIKNFNYIKTKEEDNKSSNFKDSKIKEENSKIQNFRYLKIEDEEQKVQNFKYSKSQEENKDAQNIKYSLTPEIAKVTENKIPKTKIIYVPSAPISDKKFTFKSKRNSTSYESRQLIKLKK